MPPAEPVGSLYVGDLAPEVTEHTLFELFQSVGPVASVKVCRDKHTNNSLGYAYVNFHNMADAERALDTMNFTSIRGRSCRIMWVEKDKTARDKGLGNIFIKNLDASIDHKTLFDTFSMFGSIRSCKVSYDKEGNSLGYGFVHYSDPKCAEAAIEKINGMVIAEKKVEVVPYEAKSSRQENSQFTNIFVKNFPLTSDPADLEKLCKEIGEVTSFSAPQEADGKLKGFFFCNFADHETAAKAVEELNEKEVEGMKLLANQHKSKAQRKNESKPNGTDINIYVKNLPIDWDSEALKTQFEQFGKVRTTKVMMDNVTHVSRGFGFVVFEDNEAASKAMAEMNGTIVEGKELYVAIAQTKEQRKVALAKQFQSSRPPMGLGGQMPPHMMGGRLPMMMPGPYGRPMMPPHMMGPMPGMRAPPMMPRRPMPPMKPMSGARGLDVDRMLGMDSKQQKQEMGERLYPLVQRIEPKLAGKITGMLLEMDTTELMMLLESGDDLLIAKVNEAVQVLKNHA